MQVIRRTHANRLTMLCALFVALGLVLSLVPGTSPSTARAQSSPQLTASDPLWQAQFWNNPNLSGPPALTRTDPEINFRWGTGSPAAGITADDFSARWTRNVSFPDDGIYRFTLTSDDGSRLFIDDQLIIDAWYNHEARTFVVDRTLAAGSHSMRVEYYDNVGPAQVQLSWTAVGKQQPTSTNWRGEYYNNRDLLGDPVLVRQDPSIDFNWGQGSPQPGTINNDNFSVRWMRFLLLPPGTYRFRATADDGVRVYVNNRPIIDQWREGPATAFQSDPIQLSGLTMLRVDYFDATGEAQIQVVYERVDNPPNPQQPTPTAPGPPAGNAWRGEYYNNTGLSGQPALVRGDADIDFNWGTASPAPGVVNPDDFSVRWTRTINFQPGTYRFKISVDDGARLWVNNQLVIDQWRQGSQADYAAEVYIPDGNTPVRLEYVEYKEQAVIRLTWAMQGGGTGGGGSSGGSTTEEQKRPVNPKSKWVGDYYSNSDLAGVPVFQRDDSRIDFDWGYGSPDPRLPANSFSVRWTNTFSLDSGHYRFTTETDDGVRLYVDGKLVIDEWRIQPATAYSTDIRLGSGSHTVVMEYQQRGGYALARLNIYQLIQGTPPVGNIITCVPPQPQNYAWIKLYRLNGNNQWVAVSRGIGTINPTGFLKIDGLPVDVNRFGNAGEPYRVEQWINGKVVQSTGDFQRGQPEFRVRVNADNSTPWGCPR